MAEFLAPMVERALEASKAAGGWAEAWERGRAESRPVLAKAGALASPGPPPVFDAGAVPTDNLKVWRT